MDGFLKVTESMGSYQGSTTTGAIRKDSTLPPTYITEIVTRMRNLKVFVGV